MHVRNIKLLLGFIAPLTLVSCASGPEVKKQAYAELPNTRTFEAEFPAVWKALEAHFRNYKITERDPEEVDPIELKKLTERSLKTDWIIGQSRDKYIEYKVNGYPRKQYLQTKVRYDIVAHSVLGGVNVKVTTYEEIERLGDDGKPAGWDEVKNVDSSRAAEVLDKINARLLSAPVL